MDTVYFGGNNNFIEVLFNIAQHMDAWISQVQLMVAEIAARLASYPLLYGGSLAQWWTWCRGECLFWTIYAIQLLTLYC